MFCRNCGNEIGETAACCTKCGVANGDGDKFCPNCGVETTANQAICSKCGVRLNKKKVSGGLGGMKAKKPFKRKRDGKILGGVFSGAEECLGINRWIRRIIFLILPIAWPITLIAYIVVCCATEIE